MEKDNIAHNLFYELIRISVGLDILIKVPSQTDWCMMYEMAKSQAILGICFNGVQKLYKEHPEAVVNLPFELRMKWLGKTVEIQKKNIKMYQKCNLLASEIGKSGLRNCVLKGQGLAILYTNELQSLRQSGDIDLWVEGKRNDIVEFIRSKGVKVYDIHLVHARAEFFEKVPVEIHFRPSWMYNPFLDSKLQSFFVLQASGQFAHYDEKVGFAYPTVFFNLVHSMVHINRHVFEDGIGLRQLMDYYFILKHSSREERSEAYNVLCSVGLRKFVGAVMYVMQEVFLLEEDQMLCMPNSIHGSRLLDSIMAGGNFGKALGLKHGRNKLEKGLLQLRHNLPLMLPYANEAMWIPFFQAWHYGWRKKHGYL